MDEMIVKVALPELKATIQANRDNHRTLFLEAVEGWRRAMLAHLEDLTERVKSNKPVELMIRLPQPEDHTPDYDRVLRMLEMHQDDDIKINSEDFAQFVMDDWAWKRQWITSNSHYSAKIR